LVKGSDFLVESAVRIAKQLGISEFVIGLTLIAIGTSLPELSASLMASFSGNPEIVIGNVLGSNIANIGLILGVSSVIAVLAIEPKIFKRDVFIFLGISFLCYIFALDGIISSIDGIILLISFFLYLGFLFKFKPQFRRIYRFKSYLNHKFKLHQLLDLKTYLEISKKGLRLRTYRKLLHLGIEIGGAPLKMAKVGTDKQTYEKILEIYERKLKVGILHEFIIVCLSIFAIFVGAKFLIESAIDLALLLSIPTSIVALLLISIGTSLPELAVGITSARKGFGNMILGNIIGSNIANIGLVLGLSAFLAPIPISSFTLNYIITFMLLITILCVIFIRSEWIIRMFEGLIFILLYFGFIIWTLFEVVR
jgi:K+-dependent Na+/Ca+ exchanger-like protein